MDPNTDHDFASFTVSYPPDAASGRADLEATFGGRLLWISDAHCGLFTFDTETLKWYGHAFTDVTDLMTGAQSPNAMRVPAEVSGSVAIGQPAPASTGDCQE